MTSQEFGLWEAEYARMPWCEFRGDLGAGMIASTLANCHRDKKTKAFAPIDFMPLQRPEATEPNTMELRNLVGQIDG